MKTRIALLASVISILLLGVLLVQRSAPQAYRIVLRSDPFPVTLGQTSLLIEVSSTSGTLIENADVSVTTEMTHRGMLPLRGRANRAVDGAYRIPINWSMAGHWQVDVRAELPDGQGFLEEQFLLFVYSVRPFAGIDQTISYRSTREINAALESKSDTEFWIIIPQGAQEMVRTGQSEDMVPSEIRLQAAGRNTLVIRNDDIADHTIGPFFVRAGETVRQSYTQPMTYVGLCSIRGSAEIRIIVE